MEDESGSSFRESELEEMKYRDLQRIAKDSGIKANMPKSTLIKMIMEKSESPSGISLPLKKEEEGEKVVKKKENDEKVNENKKKDEEEEENHSSSSSPVKPPNSFLEFVAKRRARARKSFSRARKREESTKLIKSLLPNNFLGETPQKSNETPSGSSSESISSKKETLHTSPIPKMVSNTPASHPKQSSTTLISSKKPPSTPGSARKSSLASTFTKNANIILKEKSSVKSNNKIAITFASLKKSSAVSAPLSKSTTATPSSVNKPASSNTLRRTTATPAVKRLATPASKKDLTSSIKKSPLRSVSSGKVLKRTTASKIPRSKMPDFAKLHAQQFDKMDNLQTYLSKRQERTTNLTTPRRSPRTFQPNPTIPTSFNFGKQSTERKGIYNFTAQSNNDSQVLENISNSKKSFDLKQSLSQPLKYKPYKGKIKAWEDKMKERKLNYKSRPLDLKRKITNEGATVIKGVRLNKRAELLLQRRMKS